MSVRRPQYHGRYSRLIGWVTDDVDLNLLHRTYAAAVIVEKVHAEAGNDVRLRKRSHLSDYHMLLAHLLSELETKYGVVPS